jgi:hypothetical protein
MAAKRKHIRVVYKKLLHRKIWGLADLDEFIIEIDDRAKGKKKLELLIHEGAHCLLPEMEEKDIERIGVVLAKLLWREGCRFVDNDNSEKLQDGTK